MLRPDRAGCGRRRKAHAPALARRHGDPIPCGQLLAAPAQRAGNVVGRRRDTMQGPLAWAGKFWVAPLLAPPRTLQMAPQCQNGRKLQDIAHDFDPVSWETHVCKGPRPSRKARGTACGSAWGSTDALDARAEWRNAPRTRAGHHRCTRRAARPRRRLSGWTPASSRVSKAPQAGMWHLAGVAAGPLACGGVGACQCKQQLPNL